MQRKTRQVEKTRRQERPSQVEKRGKQERLSHTEERKGDGQPEHKGVRMAVAMSMTLMRSIRGEEPD